MRIRKGTYFALLMLTIIGLSNFCMIHHANAYTNAYYEQMETIKQQEDELENLDKQLMIGIAVSLELDKDDPLQVVALGVRVGKAVAVDPLEVVISLTDLEGFKLGVREYEYGDTGSDYQSKTVQIYPKIFMTEFPALGTAGNYLVTVEMTYRAPWGEIITGRNSQEISVQEWFNITSIVLNARDTTNLIIEDTFGGVADITEGISDSIAGINTFMQDNIKVIEKSFKFGIDDPSKLTFFPIYFPTYDTDHFTTVTPTPKHYGVDGTLIDPDAYMTSFIKSLDVLVEKGIPFDVYTIDDLDALNAFADWFNVTSGVTTEVSNQNPLGGTYYLSFDPDDPDLNDPSDWVSGQGYYDASTLAERTGYINEEEIVTYRNVVINMYDKWFPIPTSWEDNKIKGGETIIELEGNRNATRWIKQIACGLLRNNSLLYNVNGKIFESFFCADGGSHAIYDIDDVYTHENNREGLTILNDWCLFKFNQTNVDLNKTIDEFDLITTRRLLGDEIEQIKPISHSDIDVAFDSDEDDNLEFVGAFFDKSYSEQNVTKDGYALRWNEVTHSGYKIMEKYASPVGIRFSQGPAFGYTSLENETIGFEVLHGLYYKVVLDQVVLMEDTLIDSANEVDPINHTEAVYLRDLRDRIHDAWYGTEANNYEDNLDLAELNQLFLEHRFHTGNESIPWAENKIIELTENNTQELSEVEQIAVDLDEQLNQAGSDIDFGFFGNLLGGVGAVGGAVGGAVVGGIIGTAIAPGIGTVIGAGIGAVAGGVLGGLAGFAIGNFIDNAIPTGFNDIKATVVEIIEDWFPDVGEAIEDTIKQINTVIGYIKNAIISVLTLIGNLAQAVANQIASIADAIRDISANLQDIVTWAYGELVANTEALLDNLATIKGEISKTIGFYVQVQNGLFKLIEESEFAAGLLRYASTQFGQGGVTREIFFKEVDVMKPLTLAESGDSGLYVTQLGTEVIDEIYYVTMYKGQMVSVDDIDATYQYYLDIADPISISPLATGLYRGDFSIAGAGDWMTKANVSYTSGSKVIKATSIDKTLKIEPSLQPDAYPVVSFDPDAVVLRTGENYLMQVGIDNLMYSKPNVTVRVELVSPLGLLVGLRETIVELNTEGEDAELVELEANMPFYIPAGEYDLVVKVIEDNGDVTRKVYKVQVVAENFIFGIIGAILSFLGIGLVLTKTRQKRRSKNEILLARSDSLLQPYSVIDKKKLKKCAPNDWECLLE